MPQYTHYPSHSSLNCIVKVLAIAVTLSACSNGSQPDALEKLAPNDTTRPAILSSMGSTLGKNTPVVIRFNESMRTASLQLSGALALASDGGFWSTTVVENDTLTLSPRGGSAWPVGTRNDLNIQVQDASGNALPAFTASYFILPVFETFQAAGVVLGQPDFASNQHNQGGSIGPNTQAGPFGNPGVTETGRLFVAEVNNFRVIGYDAIPTTNNANATLVLGQPDLTTRFISSGPTRSNLRAPNQALVSHGKLIITDYSNDRVLVYNNVPSDSTALPDVVIGQPDFTTANRSCDRSTLVGPETVAVTPDGKLIVTLYDQNRVMIWNSIPATNGVPADLVLGQSDFTHCTENDDNQDALADATTSARTLFHPSGVWTDGTRLVINDASNHRTLIWNTFPTQNFQAANVVLGQANFSNRAARDDNQDGVTDNAASARTFNLPFGGLTSNGTQLFVADELNNRILVWNTFPVNNFAPADIVLGQSNFTSFAHNDANQDGIADGIASAQTFHGPGGLSLYQDNLIITDYRNNRTLVFKSR